MDAKVLGLAVSACLSLVAVTLALEPAVGAGASTTRADEGSSPAARVSYFALGDSYASGEGVRSYLPGTDTSSNRCHRSAFAHPTRFRLPDHSQALYVESPSRVRFSACSGATTRQILTTAQNPTQPPQIAQLTASNAPDKLVTITIGGNNVDFVQILSFCATNFRRACQNERPTWANGATLAEEVDRRLTRLTTQLRNVYASLRTHSDSVWVLGYPMLFPDTPAEQNCAKLQVFSPAEQNYLRSQQVAMNARMAEVASAVGVHFVDVTGWFANHEVCSDPAGGGEWIRRPVLIDPPQLLGLGSFHPNAEGQLQYALALEAAVRDRIGAGCALEPTGLPTNPAPGSATSICFVTEWGSWGAGADQIGWLSNIAVGPGGKVFVTSTNNTVQHRVHRFDPAGVFLNGWGSFGNGAAQFNDPGGIAVHPNRDLATVYVADEGNHRIQMFGPDGAYVGSWGRYGTGNGQFNRPSGVAVDYAGNVYVADSGNNRIQRFTSTGTFVTKWGTAGTGNGQFNSPSDVAVDNSGNVYVSDTWNHRIQRFTASGSFVTRWGTRGSGTGQFDLPVGLGVDGAGNVYVADYLNDRVQKFAADGRFLLRWGQTGTADGQFREPIDVAVAPDGAIFVADDLNHRIQRFCC